MKLIELSGSYGSKIGNYAQVDDEDYEYLNQWKWHTKKHGNTYYVRRTVTTTVDVRKQIFRGVFMHRLLLNLTDPNRIVDHKDRNGLNNQKNNIREVTHSQNTANSKRSKKCTNSKYIGVERSEYIKKDGTTSVYWRAMCTKKGKYCAVKTKTEVEAALAYNEMAIKIHGTYARLNIIDGETKQIEIIEDDIVEMEKQYWENKQQKIWCR